MTRGTPKNIKEAVSEAFAQIDELLGDSDESVTYRVIKDRLSQDFSAAMLDGITVEELWLRIFPEDRKHAERKVDF